VLDVKRDLEQGRNVEPSIMKESQYYILVLIVGKNIPKRSLYLLGNLNARKIFELNL